MNLWHLLYTLAPLPLSVLRHQFFLRILLLRYDLVEAHSTIKIHVGVIILVAKLITNGLIVLKTPGLTSPMFCVQALVGSKIIALCLILIFAIVFSAASHEFICIGLESLANHNEYV